MNVSANLIKFTLYNMQHLSSLKLVEEHLNMIRGLLAACF